MINEEGNPPPPPPGQPEDGDGEDVGKSDELRPKPSKQPDFPGRELFRGGSAREILGRIYEGDPLGVMPRVEEWLKKHAVLIETDRVFNSTVARIAFEGETYQGDPPFDKWVSDCIAKAVDLLLDHDTMEEEQGIPPREPYDDHYYALSAVLGIEPPLCRRAALVFHQLPNKTRQVFYKVAMEGKSFNRIVAEGYGPPEKAKERLQYAFTMMSTLGRFGLGGPDGNDGWEGRFEDV